MENQGFNFEAIAAKLVDPNIDVPTKVTLALEIREHIEIVQSVQYPRFLSSIIPAFSYLLNNIKPAFADEVPEQRLRNTVLEIMQRLPYYDALRPYATEIMSLVMETICNDNEENTAICLRIIIELHKNFRNIAQLEEFVQPFFNFFKGCLDMLPQNVHDLIDEGNVDMVLKDATMGMPDVGDSNGRSTLKSVNSFKVLAECPIILVLLFQIYKRFIAMNIPDLVPLLLSTIQIRAALQKEYARVAGDGSEYVVGMNPEIKNVTVYAEFFAAQVKIMSFLAYIIRGFSTLIKPHQQTIADCVVNLLLDCPTDVSAARKELLVAARHILSTDFRVAFIPWVNVLFNEEILVGRGVTSRETLRPLAYSLLADLVHHVRQDLTLEQIEQTLDLYTRNMHDASLAPSIQTMCAKLLLNMIDCIVAHTQKDESRRLLMKILEAFAFKVSVLKDIVACLFYRYEKYGDQVDMDKLSTDWALIIDLQHLMPIRTSLVAYEHYNSDILRDYKFLLKTLVLGLKTIVFGLKTICITTSANNTLVYRRMSESEVELMSQLYRDGLDCFQIFHIDSSKQNNNNNNNNPQSRSPLAAKEEKEILEHFVTVFTLIDPAVFHEIFQLNTPFFFDKLCKDGAMLAIPQYLLASEAVSRNFSSILLQFLMENISQLGNCEDQNRSTLYLRLFKLVFMAVTLYPDANESVLQPHINDLITLAIQESFTAKYNSQNYFLLLRALFRNIGGGRFELLYKEVLPLLPFLLKTLNNLLLSTSSSTSKDLFVELCLTVPVRLSVLLPHLHHLMRPLVLSLGAGPELVSQGLRTLELCIDNLTAEFLDPILRPVMKEMMQALWKHLQPQPYNQAHSHATLRILGKLGGRNRKHLYNKTTSNNNNDYSKQSLVEINVQFESSRPVINLDMQQAINSCMEQLPKVITEKEECEKMVSFIQGLLQSYPDNLQLIKILLHLSLNKLDISIQLNHVDEASLADALTELINENHSQELTDYCMQLLPVNDESLLTRINKQFVNCCYQRKSTGGLHGLAHVWSIDTHGSAWIDSNQLETIQALLYLLKINNNPLIKQTLLDKVVSKTINVEQIILLIVGELTSPVDRVRQTCREVVEMLSKSPRDLLEPYIDRLILPIYSKPLRALSFPMQIANVDAIKYCLELQLLQLNDELMRVIQECLALADADDSSLTSNKTSKLNLDMLVKLKSECILFLSTAMQLLQQQDDEHQATRLRICQLFFKCIYSQQPPIVQAAKQGLREAVGQQQQQQKIPKEILQTGLRPILMNLSDYTRLSVDGLRGLGRLLELLTSYFKVEIGQKLLDHLQKWAKPQVLQDQAVKPLNESTEISIILEILNVIPLLPAGAYCFMDEMVTTCLQLEMHTRRTITSPFRQPLLKYCQRFAKQSIDYLVQRLDDSECCGLFAWLLHQSDILSEQMLSNIDQLLLMSISSLEQAVVDNCVWIFHSIKCKQLPKEACDWLLQHLQSLDNLSSITRKRLVQVIAKQKRHLVDLVQNVNRSIVGDQVIVKSEILSCPSDDYEHVLTRIADDGGGGGSVGTNLCTVQLYSLWSSKVSSECRMKLINILINNDNGWNNIQLLQLSKLLITNCQQESVNYRKELIKFAWGFVRCQDALVRHSAFVVLSAFTQQFDTPPKIVLQLFVTLLRSHQTECKLLVRQSLDLLLPSIQQRLSTHGGGGGGDDQVPTWIRWTRKILVDDGHLIPQLISIWQMIIRHPQLYQEYRDQFIHQIVGSLARLGLALSSTNDTKQLTLDLISLIYHWESTSSSNTLSDSVKEMLYKYLIRFLLSSTSSASSGSNSSNSNSGGGGTGSSSSNSKEEALKRIVKIQDLIQDFHRLEHWRVSISLKFIQDRLFQQQQQQQNECELLVNLLPILITLCSNPSNTNWLSDNQQFFQLLFERLPIVDNTQSVLIRLFSELSITLFNNNNNSNNLPQAIVQTIQQQLSDNLMINNCKCIFISILSAARNHLHPVIDSCMQQLCKCLVKLCREYQQMQMIKDLVQIIMHRIQAINENKKQLLSSLSLLIDKHQTSADHLDLLQLIINSTQLILTLNDFTAKEKSGLLLKFIQLERLELFQKQFLSDIILPIYTSNNSELISRLEPLFLIGCRSATTQQQFYDLFNKNIPKSLFTRWSYVVGVQNWQPLSDGFWLQQGLHLILDSCKQSQDSPLIQGLLFLISKSQDLTINIWKQLFRKSWEIFSERERHDLNKYYIALLSKEYHLQLSQQRPNPIQCLLESINDCQLLLPPQLLNYLAKNFCTWHQCIELLLQQSTSQHHLNLKNHQRIRELTMDALGDLLQQLKELDLFCGLWRRRSLYPETVAAVGYEQLGDWLHAQQLYESAQLKARNGQLPFADAEYCLWEDRWIECTKKLQQWDLLADLSKHDQNLQLQLECAWRVTDWIAERELLQHTVALASDNPRPRQKVFEAFLQLAQMQDSFSADRLTELQKICDEGIQLALRKWHSLPPVVSQSHLSLLQLFQQFVELQEASHIYSNLNTTISGVGTTTSTSNSQLQQSQKAQAAQELKGTLQTWRDRLPNLWDDVNIWSELVAWRQHIFSSINKAYQPIASNAASSADQPQPPASTNPMTYRGYHEIAWIINRFAHVARKHHLIDVCQNALTKIYTLPNIEINDAFLKLREQAKCYFDTGADLATGLEVINSTNLNFFQPLQRSEFFAIKGIFFQRLQMPDEANAAFSAALHIDTQVAKSWSAWARFNDERLQVSSDQQFAADAVNCYLQAIGLYKNARCRKYISRILWLLEISSENNWESVQKAFDAYKGDVPIWYWVTFIPQLLHGLNHQHGRLYKQMLIRIAKSYPQALYLPLRSLRDDYRPMREGKSPQAFDDMDLDDSKGSKEDVFLDKPAWEHVEDLMSILKTAYPLLALSIETITDQLLNQLKPSAEEDLYRILVALQTDAIQHACSGEVEISSQMESTINHLISNTQFEKEFKVEFNGEKSTIELLKKYQKWIDRIQLTLEKRPRVQNLENYSHYLVEFEHQKFDEVEVPGQYLLLRDNNSDFAKIERFDQQFELVCGQGIWYRKLTFIGHDGSQHAFQLQIPSARNSRREERIIQQLRLWNEVLQRKRETRCRSISFQLPIIVPLSSGARLVSFDSSRVSLQEVMNQHLLIHEQQNPLDIYLDIYSKSNYSAEVKMEIFEHISSNLVQSNVLSNYLKKLLSSFEDLWLVRQNFITDTASIAFVSYVLSIGHRLPHRFQISQSTGSVYPFDLLPLMNNSLILSNPESVPFRLSPNMQEFMTDLGVEGKFVGCILAIASALSEHESVIDSLLGLIVKAEMTAWKQISQSTDDATMDLSIDIDLIKENCQLVKERIMELSCRSERVKAFETTSNVCQPVLDIISRATSASNLSLMDPIWHPWL